MASTIQVDKVQDTGGNTILSSNSTGTFTYEAASGANFTALTAANLTGALPAISGSSLTGVGKILQVQATAADSRTTGSGTTYADCGITDTITCATTSSKVLVIASFMAKVDSDNASVDGVGLVQQVLRDSTQVYETRMGVSYPEDSGMDFAVTGTTTMITVDSPSSTSELTYKVQVKGINATDLWEVASDISGGVFGTRSIVLIEIGA